MGGMQGHGGMGSPSMGGNMGTGMPGIPGGMPGIPSTSGQGVLSSQRRMLLSPDLIPCMSRYS